MSLIYVIESNYESQQCLYSLPWLLMLYCCQKPSDDIDIKLPNLASNLSFPQKKLQCNQLDIFPFGLRCHFPLDWPLDPI